MLAISSSPTKAAEASISSTDVAISAEHPVGVSQLLARAELARGHAATDLDTKASVTIVNKPLDQGEDSIVILKQWDGVVLEIRRNTFKAELYESDRRRDYPTEIGEFDIDEVQPRDLDLVAIGAAFRYIIGRRIRPYGQRDTIYMISFRRLPVRRKDMIDQAKLDAKAMKASLNWD